MTVDTAELETLRTPLLKFARLQLRNDAMAEDVVQETLIAALERPDRFAGQSSLKTYLTGILKHKIIDALRAGAREISLSHAGADDERTDDELFDALFDTTGHFRDKPRDWGDPDAVLRQKQFFEILELCVEKLPAKTGRVFMMREWLELDTDEICKELGVSTTHVWVMLYRARMRLRECLDLNWLGQSA
ncbi:sigma-70 family RNA polymerase sigma factor [Pandoraea sp.]|uniref:sigma-70 family RNA polymerase sigma factor n=1 Tax=Pandoraea sp. TaxID=1883445 RepID=UPI00120F674F|nr:sigma-70 family RNA polymerase sigma factor [Pandoraea sp.]TAL57296.1 MAG: sigma-70 family RNA polymerase sigma factor [Pandoraea sp.]TAM16456.1 MAG: sigma-70 family RNA polymerase sigma factor [Pandoraea sp.]